MFGATDLHAENLIACGPAPVVMDCETLFTPVSTGRPPASARPPTGRCATARAPCCVTGLLPGRGVSLGWRGVDISAGRLAARAAAGRARRPVPVDAGTDRARVALGAVSEAVSATYRAANPTWRGTGRELLTGFDELTDRLPSLDKAGWLSDAFDAFADVDVRAILRSTEAYAELSRMLWHPVSLHDEAAAIEPSHLVAHRAWRAHAVGAQ